MSRPVTDFSENRDVPVLEDKQELASVEIGIKTKDDAGRDRAPLFVSSIRKDEPIVTRKELWSYYRQSLFS
jgi:hypothetical protein